MVYKRLIYIYINGDIHSYNAEDNVVVCRSYKTPQAKWAKYELNMHQMGLEWIDIIIYPGYENRLLMMHPLLMD